MMLLFFFVFGLTFFGQIRREQKKQWRTLPLRLQRGQGRKRSANERRMAVGKKIRSCGPSREKTSPWARGGGEGKLHVENMNFFYLRKLKEKEKNWKKNKTEIKVMRMTERRGFCGQGKVIVRIWFDGCTGCWGVSLSLSLSDIKAGWSFSIPSTAILPTQSHLRSPLPNCNQMSPSTFVSTTTSTTTPVVSHTHGDDKSCVNQSSPQCCHCGWRGSHSPQCPFKRK